MRQNTEPRLKACEDLKSHCRVGKLEYVFSDPAQEIEWIALLELQRQLEAMTCVSEDQDPEGVPRQRLG